VAEEEEELLNHLWMSLNLGIQVMPPLKHQRGSGEEETEMHNSDRE
jgi:hypothetical protein